MPRFLISAIGLNRCKGTKECLERVFAHGSDFHLIATNNGSTDGTGAMMDEFAAKHSNMTVVHNAKNEGFQRPHAAAFREAARMGAEFFLCLNDDLLVREGFLGTLVAPMDQDASVAITGPHGGCESLNHAFHGEPSNGRAPDYCEGSLMLVRVRTIQELRDNLWCPGLRDIYGEDSSLSLFVQEKGFKIAKVHLDCKHVRSSTVNADPAVKKYCQEAQEHNHQFNQKRWAYYLQHRRFDLPIVVKRKYAIGDVILVTPIVDAIARSRPLSPIYVETDYPELFEGNPQVHQTAKVVRITEPHITVDLNGSYEDTQMQHILEAYYKTASSAVTGLLPIQSTTAVYPSAQDRQFAQGITGNLKRVCVINADPTTWPGKTWSFDKFSEVARSLMQQGFAVMQVGSKERRTFSGALSLVGKTTLTQLAALCERAALTITPDTSTLHIAQAVGCPTIGLFGVTSARFIATQGSKFVAVECPQDLPNAGARHRVAGKTSLDFGAECMEQITVTDVLDAVRKITL